MTDPDRLAADLSPADAAAEPDARAAAMLPAHLLEPGEIVILLTKPSPWYVLAESLRSLVAVALLGTLALGLQRSGAIPLARSDVVLATVGLFGLRLFVQGVDWLGRVYVLTDRRVIRVRGVLRVSVFECPLGELADVTLFRGWRERALGLGTVGLVPEGASGPVAWWRLVDEPKQIVELVREAKQRYG